jgi:prepilin-type N-terminal cleavage/methylation domain-containing protein
MMPGDTFEKPGTSVEKSLDAARRSACATLALEVQCDRAGITLIEVLIAMSLLSLLSVGMLVAMRLGLNTLGKTDAHLIQNRKVVNVRQIVENEIGGFIDTQADWRLVRVPFHQWEPQSMRFVTSWSLDGAWRGRAQIAALQVIPGENNVGVRLIVNETPYTGPAQAGSEVEGIEEQRVRFTPIEPGPQSFVLADKLAYCRFSYLEPHFEPPLRVWRPDWVLPTLPLGIRIDMAPLENGPAELHMSTITASFHINRTGNIGYYDVP